LKNNQSHPFELSLAPIQGITDYTFRKLFEQYFGGINKYFAPYLRVDSKGGLSNKQMRDLLPGNNVGIHVIPQIMANRPHDFISMCSFLADQGYTEVNWNLGCPYPMITNRGLGAGLLDKPELTAQILDEVLPKISLNLSIKLRSGVYNENALASMLQIFNNYPLTEVIIHPRYAKQLYRGMANRNLFAEVLPISTHPVCYNGDIASVEDCLQLSEQFPTVKHFMIGRAVISNPFLAAQIQQKNSNLAFDAKKQFAEFHAALFASYLSQSEGGDKQVILKMLGFWEYFALSFTNSDKVYKKFRKAKNKNEYQAAISEVFANETFI